MTVIKKESTCIVWDRMGTDITFQDVMNGTKMKASGWASGFCCYCWYNSLTLWKQTTDEVKVYFGIAEGKETGWKPSRHMWLSIDGQTAIETTFDHRNYMGVALTDEQADIITNELTNHIHGRRLFTDCYRFYKQRGIIRDCKKKTTSRLISKRFRKKLPLWHPVMVKEIRQENGMQIAKQRIWTGA